MDKATGFWVGTLKFENINPCWRFEMCDLVLDPTYYVNEKTLIVHQGAFLLLPRLDRCGSSKRRSSRRDECEDNTAVDSP